VEEELTAYLANRETTMKKLRGKIKSFLPKGFGFISPEGEDGDVFYHISSVEGDWEPAAGDAVEFTVVERNGKPEAAEVVILGGQNDEAEDGEPTTPATTETP
jgi:cold shock CspA family protein